MPYVIAVVGLAALVAAVLLVRYVGTGGGPKTMLWAALLPLATALAMLLFQVASIYYRMPFFWIAVLVLALLATLALVVRVGLDVQWKPLRVVAMFGSMLLALVLIIAVLIAAPTGRIFVPIFEVRGQQIAEASGFTVLYPAGEQLRVDYLPIDTIGKPSRGVSINYDRFLLQERKGEGQLTHAQLEKRAAAGEDPMELGRGLPSSAKYEAFEVDGNPALGVEFMENEGMPGKSSVSRMLLFEKDGVDVRMLSTSEMRYTGTSKGVENYEPVDALSFEELVRIGKSLEPAK